MPKVRAKHFSDFIKSMELIGYEYCECCGNFTHSFGMRIDFSAPFDVLPREYRVFVAGIDEGRIWWGIKGEDSSTFLRAVYTDGVGSEIVFKDKLIQALKKSKIVDVSGHFTG